MEQQLQAGGVRNFMSREADILQKGIELLVDNFKKGTGYFPQIDVQSGYSSTCGGGMQEFTTVNITIRIKNEPI